MRSCVGSAAQRGTPADETRLDCAGGGPLSDFGLRALLLIDATALWSDELYSVGEFQPSFGSLLAMLREDTHPPAYYGFLWLWGTWSAKPQSACVCCPGWCISPVA